MDLISVIIPVYNVEPYLARCVESVKNQTYKNLEIILVDDESPDRCPQMCEQMAKEDSRIKVIHKKNGGLGYARNSGLDVATGEYVTFIDSDDWISHTHIENLYNAIIKGKADVAIGGHTSVDTNAQEVVHYSGVESRVYRDDEIKEHILLSMIGPDVECKHDVVIQCSSCMNLYKMSVIADNNISFSSERDAVSEDMLFNIDFLYRAKAAVALEETGYFYFTNTQSITRHYNPKGIERTLKFYDVINDKALDYALESGVSLRIDRTFLMIVRVQIKHIVASSMSKKDKLKLIKNVLNNQTINNVLQGYPIEFYIPSIRIFAKLMRDKKVRLVYSFAKAREIAEGQNLTKKALRLIGIGKH